MYRRLLSLARGAAELAFPASCEHCGLRTYGSAPLCWRCIRSLERPGGTATASILRAFPLVTDGIRLHCLWYYERDGPLRDVIHALKYQNRPWYGQFLGEALASTLNDEVGNALVAALPIHPIRLLERGYNQSAWIANGVASALGLRVCSGMVVRARPTGSQTGLKREDRWLNVRDAFSATSALGVRHVLLIDDVVTTGATALSAALTLRAAGAHCVTIAATGLARV